MRDKNQALGLLQVPQLKLRSTYPILKAQIGMSPARSQDMLDCSLTTAGETEVDYRAISGSPEAQTLVTPA